VAAAAADAEYATDNVALKQAAMTMTALAPTIKRSAKAPRSRFTDAALTQTS